MCKNRVIEILKNAKGSELEQLWEGFKNKGEHTVWFSDKLCMFEITVDCGYGRKGRGGAVAVCSCDPDFNVGIDYFSAEEHESFLQRGEGV